MRRAIPAVLSLLAVAASGPSGPVRAAGTGGSGDALPADVAAYIDRRAGCIHWGGEDATDATRGREIAAALKDLGCDRLESDEARLRQHYGRSPRVLKAIDQAGDRDG